MKGLAQQQLIIIIAILAVIGGIAVLTQTQFQISPPPAEQPLQVAVGVIEAPLTVNAGQDFVVTFRVDSNKQFSITHAAVHFNPTPVADPNTPSDYIAGLTEILSGTIPKTFTATGKLSQSGTFYYRAHAIVEGKNYWSEEKSLSVVSAPQQVTPPPTPPTAAYTIEADDSGFYTDGTRITSITPPKDSSVTVTFKVRSMGVYFGGLDFRSIKFSTSKVPPGGETTVQFTADQSFTVSSYWPASSQLKANLQVSVV